MRLINVDTLELEEFFDVDIPEYAILSHTWGKDEVTYQDLCWLTDYDKNQNTYASLEGLLSQIGRNMQVKADSIRQRSGYEKIVQSARLTMEYGLQYVWVDTCCIDKTSSAELSEAINSMFRWYEKSYNCFAVLSDVRSTGGTENDVRFEDSRWFTRGWTLQELLAPREVWFYDRQWTEIGSRRDMADRLHDVTSIPISALKRAIWKPQLVKGDFSLAQRMSWASKRQTSRIEDIAYCLLGLFDINMPLLYGEGEKAFSRLQQEIVKNSSGQSLLAWGMDQPLELDRLHSHYPPPTLFAPSPAALAGGDVLDISKSRGVAFQLNNRGLQIPLNIFQVVHRSIYYAQWDVMLEQDNIDEGDHLCLCLPLIDASIEGEDKYTEDGQEMMKCAHPVPVVRSRLPLSRSRKKILIRDRIALTAWTGDAMPLSILPVLDEKATMVESFPPVFDRGTCYFDVTRGVLLFRFVVPKAYAGSVTSKGSPVGQFVVAVDFETDNRGFKRGDQGYYSCLTAVCVWTGYVGHGTGRNGGPYVSLLDAFLGEEKLLDMSQWFNDRIMYNSTELSVQATAKVDLGEITLASMSIELGD